MASYHIDRALARLYAAAEKPERVEMIEAEAQHHVDEVKDPKHRQFFEATFAEIKESEHSPEGLERVKDKIEQYQNEHWPNEQTQRGENIVSEHVAEREHSGQISGKSGSDGRPRMGQLGEQASADTANTSAQNTESADQRRGSDGRPRMDQPGERASAGSASNSAQNTESADQQRGSDGEAESSQQETSNTSSESNSRERNR